MYPLTQVASTDVCAYVVPIRTSLARILAFKVNGAVPASEREMERSKLRRGYATHDVQPSIAVECAPS